MRILHTPWPRLAAALGLALALTLALARPALAFDGREGDQVTIAAGEVVDDDVLITANTAVVNGTVNGDLIVFGNKITIAGTVNGSVVAAGQEVTITGKVAGTVYGAGANVIIGSGAVIGRNVAVGAYSSSLDAGATVGRDLVAAGYQHFLDGEVKGDASISAGAIELNGDVGGDVTTEVGVPTDEDYQFTPFLPPSVKPGLRVGSNAQIGGKLTYTSDAPQASAIESAPVGGVVYQTPTPDEEELPPTPPAQVSFGGSLLRWILTRVRDLVTLLVLGTLTLWLLPGVFGKVVEKAQTQTLPAAGWGLLTAIVGYAAAALIALALVIVGVLFGLITLGGLSNTVFGVGFSGLGALVAVFTLLVSYGSKLVIAYLVSRIVLEKIVPQWAGNRAVVLVLGVVVYVILRGIPVLGWVIGVIVTLMGLGAMWLAVRDWRAARAAMPVAQA